MEPKLERPILNFKFPIGAPVGSFLHPEVLLEDR